MALSHHRQSTAFTTDDFHLCPHVGAGLGPVSSHRDPEHHREPQHQDQPRTQQRLHLGRYRQALRRLELNSPEVVDGLITRVCRGLDSSQPTLPCIPDRLA